MGRSPSLRIGHRKLRGAERGFACKFYCGSDHNSAMRVMPIIAVAPQPAQANDGRARNGPSRCAIGYDQHHHYHDRDGDDPVDNSGPDK